MEGSFGGGGGGGDDGVGKNGGPSDGRLPNPFAGAYRQFLGGALGGSPCKSALVRHDSLAKTTLLDVTIEVEKSNECCETDFFPILRSGAWTDIGFRHTMEDAYVCSDNFMQDYGLQNFGEGPSAFYGVFDGHGGRHAADFACSNLPRFLLEDEDFPKEIERAVASAFLQTDTAFAEVCSVNTSLASGTTALAALVIGRSLVVANAGDCRAVLCRRGKAIDMSQDHKPACSKERKRIEALGGHVYDGYLNGLLNVARAIGDWHINGMKDSDGSGPLSAEPENAVDFARRKLQEHNDPAACCKELVDEALKRKSSDNLAVVLVCFQSKPPPVLTAPRRRVQRSISAEGLRELQSFLDSLAD
ncbi:hypothetical protein OPV22_025255 [Ensete ventricosum]|uniref:protein-serine/threonine phosphatase n=1 Tax=Ensete ventricosum TaxID=4639 RepID=A0AAV8QH33_ENSVE|nr:hypothetical protein OPV22_025255 [Ensete ventricosum]